MKYHKLQSEFIFILDVDFEENIHGDLQKLI